MSETRRRRRHTFDSVADLYDRVRPGYPASVFDDLTRLTGLGPGTAALEIGCGTGQATIPLSRRGADVVAIELGPALARLARENTASGRVRIVCADFDQWEGPASAFDLVLAATAFHWLDPDTRCRRIARLLRRGGHLAVLANQHVSDGRGDAFFAATQPTYREAFGPGPAHRLPAPDTLRPADLAPDLLQPIAHRLHPWRERFDAARYLDTLRTYSDHRDLPPARRARLFERITALIEGDFGGVIEKHWVATLTIARARG